MRFYNGVLPDGDPDRIFMVVDPAWGGGDFVASPVCIRYDKTIYVPDVVYNNGDKTVTQPEIVDKAIKYNVAAMRIEATKMTAEYADGIDTELKNRDHRVNVEKTTKHYTGNGKEQRIFDKAPDIREHFVFLEPGLRSKEYELFMQNVYSFSINGKNKHDDAPDSLAMAADYGFGGGNTMTVMQRIF